MSMKVPKKMTPITHGSGHLNRLAMRTSLFLLGAALVFSNASQAAVAECPLSLSLKTSPGAFVERLKTLNVAQSQRFPGNPPTIGQCDYRVSSLNQDGASGGLCTIGGARVYVAFTDILDSKSQVVMDMYMVTDSSATLPPIRAALSKIGSPVARDIEPRAWTLPRLQAVVDAVYGHDDDLWIVSHPEGAPHEPHDFVVMHVLREWLDFALRDPDKCVAIPPSPQDSAK